MSVFLPGIGQMKGTKESFEQANPVNSSYSPRLFGAPPQLTSLNDIRTLSADAFTNGINGMTYHAYDFTSESGVHNLKIDDVTIPVTQNDISSQYITSSGIVSGTPDSPIVYRMAIKRLAYKKL